MSPRFLAVKKVKCSNGFLGGLVCRKTCPFLASGTL